MALGITTRTAYDPLPGQPPPPTRITTQEFEDGLNDSGIILNSHAYGEYDIQRVFTQTKPRKVPDNALESERKAQPKSPRDPLNLGPLRKEQRRVAALMQQGDVDLPVHWNYRNTIPKRTAPVYLCKQFDPEGKFRNPALDFLREGLADVKAKRQLDALEKNEAKKIKEEKIASQFQSLDADLRPKYASKDYKSEVPLVPRSEQRQSNKSELPLVTRSLGEGKTNKSKLPFVTRSLEERQTNKSEISLVTRSQRGKSNLLPDIRDNNKVTPGKYDLDQTGTYRKESFIAKSHKKNSKRRKNRRQGRVSKSSSAPPPPLVNIKDYDYFKSTNVDYKQRVVPNVSDEPVVDPIDQSDYIDEERNSEVSFKSIVTFPPLLDTKPPSGTQTGDKQQIRYHYGIPTKGVTNEEVIGAWDEDSFVVGKKRQGIPDSGETQHSNSSQQMVPSGSVKGTPKSDRQYCNCKRPKPKPSSRSGKCGECLGSGQHEMWCSSKEIYRQKTVCQDCGLPLASTSVTSINSSSSSSRSLTVVSIVESLGHGSEENIRKSTSSTDMSRKKLKSEGEKRVKKETKPKTPVKIEMEIPSLPEVKIKEATQKLKYEPQKKARAKMTLMSFDDVNDEPEPIVEPIVRPLPEKTEEQIQLENKMFQIQLLSEQEEKAKRLGFMKDLNPNSKYGEAYSRALADARAKRLPLEPWMLGMRTTNAYVFSYYNHLPNRCFCGQCGTCDKPATLVLKAAKNSKKETEMKSIFGNINVNDYYPGEKKNPLKLNNFLSKNEKMKFK